MSICRNAEGVHGQRKFGNTCFRQTAERQAVSVYSRMYKIAPTTGLLQSKNANRFRIALDTEFPGQLETDTE